MERGRHDQSAAASTHREAGDLKDLRGGHSLSPTQFYACEEPLFTNGSAALVSKRVPERNKDQERIEILESKLRQKDEVIAELITEQIALNREFGDL